MLLLLPTLRSNNIVKTTLALGAKVAMVTTCRDRNGGLISTERWLRGERNWQFSVETNQTFQYKLNWVTPVGSEYDYLWMKTAALMWPAMVTAA